MSKQGVGSLDGIVGKHGQHFRFMYNGSYYDFEWYEHVYSGEYFWYVSLPRTCETCEDKTILSACKIWAESFSESISAATFLVDTIGIKNVERFG